jgi:hypothetical protein
MLNGLVKKPLRKLRLEAEKEKQMLPKPGQVNLPVSPAVARICFAVVTCFSFAGRLNF